MQKEISVTQQKILDSLIAAGCHNGFVAGQGEVVGVLPEPKVGAEILVRQLANDSFKVWIVVNGSPKSITTKNGNGYAPQSRFKTVGEAFNNAMANPFY